MLDFNCVVINHQKGGDCNEHDTIYAISSDFGDRMTTQSMGLTSLLSESLDPKNILKRVGKAKHEERTQRNVELDELCKNQ